MGEYKLTDLIGAKARVISLSHQQDSGWTEGSSDLVTISDIAFRVEINGKCIPIIAVEEYPNMRFTDKDLIILELPENE